MRERHKRENAYIDLNAVKLLFQKIEEKISPSQQLKRYTDFRELARKISRQSFPDKNFEWDEDMIVKPKTLQRYWGTVTYGNNDRRFSPNSVILDRLAEFCGYKSWQDFSVIYKDEIVTNILPYEKSIRYFRQGIKFVDDIPIGKIQYFGCETRYIALLRQSNDVQLVDYKNVFCFKSFPYLIINGIEVIPNDSISPNFKFIY
ncbi:MAG: hypothetical protein K2M85_06755 [Paramuribaculum sp.]|nr:hypothetical protein [Paramuribaculum sp.]